MSMKAPMAEPVRNAMADRESDASKAINSPDVRHGNNTFTYGGKVYKITNDFPKDKLTRQ